MDEKKSNVLNSQEIKNTKAEERNRVVKYIVALVTALFTVLLFYGVHLWRMSTIQQRDHVKIGLIFDGDESTPYTANFIYSMEEIKNRFGDKVEVTYRNNVPYESTELVIRELAEDGCDMIFTNSYGYGEIAKKMAKEYPDIEFCEATCDNANTDPVYPNYHTFMGEIYQGRFIAGKVAGLKMKEMIEEGLISEEEAWVGYVGAYPFAEVISGYTAFFLGIRSECPTARMRVKYTNTWTSYALEKKYAEELIGEGCVVISQHSDTIGPAIACEKSEVGHPVYHVGYNQDMIDVAPTTSLISTRINWTPYMIAAVDAVLNNKKIENMVKGHIHGNDVGAGFERDWVRMLELNDIIAAKGSESLVKKTIKAFKKGEVKVFYGDYTGVNPEDTSDTIHLKDGYQENKHASAPSFHYILKDVIIVEN